MAANSCAQKVTNSISKVKEETLKQGLYSNPAQALSGAVAGLSVSQTSGNPGAALPWYFEEVLILTVQVHL